jgi:hypothetical protein
LEDTGAGDNTRMYLKELGCKCVDWIYLAQERINRQAIVNTVIDFRGLLNGWKLLDQLCDSQFIKQQNAIDLR